MYSCIQILAGNNFFTKFGLIHKLYIIYILHGISSFDVLFLWFQYYSSK